MREGLLSIGIDLGTTTTQMILSRLYVENTANVFSIPRMEITEREILYRGNIHFTPLLSADTIDAEEVRKLITTEYRLAGIEPQQIQTGAVIITGETARKENAAEVLRALSDFAGEFVVATAGPALESVLAARGAGADKAAKQQGRYVLHMDVGGGTSNLALFDPDGHLVDTGCLNVGGRLLKFDGDGRVIYRSPVLSGYEEWKPDELAKELVKVLEEAAGLRPQTERLSRFTTDKTVTLPKEPVLLSFSGGVADLIRESPGDLYLYGDLGVLLGRAIRNSALCRERFLLGEETIRATVVGAGNHATELSGSTVYCFGGDLPIHDLPVLRIDGMDTEQIRKGIARYGDRLPALALEGICSPTFMQIQRLAHKIAEAVQPLRDMLVVAVEQDMAKALGHGLQLELGKDVQIICLDGIHAPEGSYLDIGQPLSNGAALPVVVKTLAFL